jgi:3-oxoacid CoA-transferase subunit B
VNRIITDLAVIDVTPQGLVLREIAPETTVEEVTRLTGAALGPDPRGVRVMAEG